LTVLSLIFEIICRSYIKSLGAYPKLSLIEGCTVLFTLKIVSSRSKMHVFGVQSYICTWFTQAARTFAQYPLL